MRLSQLPGRLWAFARGNVVLSVAVAAALLTSLAVPPDRRWLDYFDWKTLACLFSVLAVVNALRGILFFTMLAHGIVRCFRSVRACVLALCCITFVGSMFIANDMALLTFLPLGYFVLASTGNQRLLAYTFIMQNLSANLGGMLTPFGNPQNLYLYTRYALGNLEFMSIMLLPFVVSVALIVVCCLLVRGEPVRLGSTPVPQHPWRACAYLALFALSVVMVFRCVPYQAGTLVIVVALLFLDRSALRKVDYPLLLTFVAFFVFSGNLSRLEPVRELFGRLLSHGTLLFSVLSCQVISNVPTAILLSQFTDNYRELLVGVNIGGAGTLVASLASLITFREYGRLHPGGIRGYLALFAALNALFLGVLLAVMLWWFRLHPATA
ncbi:MAG: SLC13 family permease [Oligosphaeraceae bacterium]